MKFGTLLLKEIKEIIRDKRAVVSMLLVPLLAVPVIFLAVGLFLVSAENKLESQPHPVALSPDTPVPGLTEALRGTRLAPFVSDSPAQMVQEGVARLGLSWEREDDGTLCLTLFYDASDEASGYALGLARQALDSLRQESIAENMERMQIPPWLYKPFSISEHNIAGPERMTAYFLGIFVGYMLVLLIFTGGMYPAMDLLAGERERHTIEILLSAPVSRGTIVAAKITAVALAALAAGLANILSYAVSLLWLARSVPELASVSQKLPFSLGGTLVVAVSVLPLVLLAASLEVALSSYAKSYREAQTYLTPLTLVVIFPAMASMMPGATLTPLGALVPIYNTAMAIKGALMGDLGVLPLILSLVANACYAGAATFLATLAFGREGILRAD